MTIVRESSTPEYWNSLYKSGTYRTGITGFERLMFTAYVAPQPGMVALDAGCGRGEVAAHLGGLGLAVLGLDFAAAAIEEAQRDFTDHSGVSFDLHDFNTAPMRPDIRPRSLDLIVCRLSLAFLDRERFLVDARRWLTPDGVLLVTTHVVERTPPDLRHRGLSEKAVDGLKTGWGKATRYDLTDNGSLTCVALRGPYG
ncbi:MULTISPECIES: class I SAM-dependent methyltransferase [Streptomyces]